MRLLRYLRNLLFPPKCCFCRRLLQDGQSNPCPECEKALPYTRGKAVTDGRFFQKCISPLFYEDAVREAILRYKFQNAAYYAEPFGKLLSELVRERLRNEFDLITWVPLSKKRLRKRGYDQAMLLARATADHLEAVCVPLLEKFRNVPAQSGLGRVEQRRANVSGVYRAVRADLIAGKRILLIDDVVTTGSTLSECARILLLSGAASVVCATLARSTFDS